MSGSMDDFDSLDNRQHSSGDAMTPELEPLHRRILSDSEMWRSTLPDIAPLEEQVAMLSARLRERDSRLPRTYSTREEPIVFDTPNPVHVDTPSDTRSRSTTPRSGPRTLLAGGTALALVALFAIFFVALPHGGKTSGPGSSPSTAVKGTPTVAPAHSGTWLPLTHLSHLAGVPIVSPANPSVVYEDDHAHLRRSADGGKTWSDLPLPSDFPSGDSYTWLDLFVSPLDANTVWATANLVNPNNPTSCPFATTFAFTGGNALYGGSVPCQVQHVSTDGGTTWKLIKLPFAFMLGTNSADRMAGNVYFQYSAPPQAQGHLIYTMTDDGPLAASATDAHLAVSADGGATWQDASTRLTGAGHHVCTFGAVPVPTSSTVFAVTSDAGCGPDYSNSAQSLWRSDDAGAHWTQVTLPANRIVLSLAATGGARPTLYAAMPSLSGNSHAGITSAAATEIFASTDGGTTWHGAPAAGVPVHATTAGPMVTLSDGSIVQAFVVLTAQPSADGTTTFAFGRWRAGDSTWSQLSSLNLYGISQLLDVPPATGIGDMLWLSVLDSNLPSNMTYGVRTYTP